jgi:predicted house-cleaning noncanonical NTP pyrophosphatase (MazG superfamily)
MSIMNKLVRDLIPDIVVANGGVVQYRYLGLNELTPAFNTKLKEELAEYWSAKTSEESIEELADIVEVIYALAKSMGVSEEAFNAVRQTKLTDRGGFDKGVFLVSTD